MKKIGHWELNSRYKSVSHLSHLPGINFVLKPEFGKKTNVVYVFVTDSSAAYVGETTKGMTGRFASYRYGNPEKRDTDNRVKVGITKALNGDRSVTIWAWAPQANLRVAGKTVKVPASKPVEELLIEKLRPPFNRKRL